MVRRHNFLYWGIRFLILSVTIVILVVVFRFRAIDSDRIPLWLSFAATLFLLRLLCFRPCLDISMVRQDRDVVVRCAVWDANNIPPAGILARCEVLEDIGSNDLQ